jgi:hypothetical protein
MDVVTSVLCFLEITAFLWRWIVSHDLVWPKRMITVFIILFCRGHMNCVSLYMVHAAFVRHTNRQVVKSKKKKDILFQE